MQPMTAAASADVEREVSAFFGGKDVPPLTLVEWRSSPYPADRDRAGRRRSRAGRLRRSST